MMKRWFILLFFAAFILVSCQSTDLSQPPEIRYGEDVCDQCNMIISEARFAAAYTTKDGTARRFDDVGGMLMYHMQHAEQVASFWVHDYDTEEWLDASKAYFVQSDQIMSPMMHGIAAFLNREQADMLAKQVGGKVLVFDELVSAYQLR